MDEPDAVVPSIHGSVLSQEPDSRFNLPVVNDTGISTGQVWDALNRANAPVIDALAGWVQNTQPQGYGQGGYGSGWSNSSYDDGRGTYPGRNGGIFGRDRYLTPTRMIDQMRLAYAAVETDDIVSGAVEATEALAFSTVGFFALDEDDEDVYNQVAASIDLDSRLREIWRELQTVSQVYVAVWWGRESFKVRGRSELGNIRRKEYRDLMVPQNITILDPLKIVPIGTTIFGREQLAYVANRQEHMRFTDIVSGDHPLQDETVARLMVGPYQPSINEVRELTKAGFPTRNLWLLNPNNVFRHTMTRPGFQRWAPVRMRAVFELLDQKQQLRQMDRAYLIGNTNFVVLITKGSDDLPATPAEIDNLQVQVRQVSRTPILVGDHRLNVSIVTPKLDNTLKAERYNTIDSRITARMYQIMQLGNYSAGAAGDSSIGLVKVIARGLESRRHMIRRTLEKHIFAPMFEMNDAFTTAPRLKFHPQSVALDFDANWATFLLELRANREISRETILSQFDLDQRFEAMLRQREALKYDDIFGTLPPPGSTTPVPPDTPGTVPPAPVPAPTVPTRRDNGGGRKGGGGRAPGTGQGKPALNPAKRDKSKTTRQLAPLKGDEELEEFDEIEEFEND